MNDYIANKRVGWIHNHFVRFSDTTQDFALNTEVSSNAQVPELQQRPWRQRRQTCGSLPRKIRVLYGNISTFPNRFAGTRTVA
jgi:hypothetical protein